MPDVLDWLFQKLLIYENFPKQPSLGFAENGLKKENIKWSAVLWVEMPCWCQRSEKYGQAALSCLKGSRNSLLTNQVSRRASLNTHHLEADWLQQQSFLLDFNFVITSTKDFKKFRYYKTVFIIRFLYNIPKVWVSHYKTLHITQLLFKYVCVYFDSKYKTYRSPVGGDMFINGLILHIQPPL